MNDTNRYRSRYNDLQFYLTPYQAIKEFLECFGIELVDEHFNIQTTKKMLVTYKKLQKQYLRPSRHKWVKIIDGCLCAEDLTEVLFPEMDLDEFVISEDLMDKVLSIVMPRMAEEVNTVYRSILRETKYLSNRVDHENIDLEYLLSLDDCSFINYMTT